MEPVSIEFVLKGGIDKEVEKVKQAIKGLGDESYLTFSHITKASNESFSSLNKGAQQQAIVLQKVIQELRQNESAQEALFRSLKEGKVTTEEYARMQARLVNTQSELRQQASEMNRQLQQEIQQNKIVSGSLEEKVSILSKLKEEYSKLNKEERENVKIGGQLVERINELNKEVDDINGNFKQTTQGGDELLDTMGLLPGVVGGSVSQFRQLLTSAKGFISSPIGLAVAGIATAFSFLKIAIDGSDTATTHFNAKLEYLSSRWSTIKGMITEGVSGIYNTITGDFDSAGKSFENLNRLNIFQGLYANMRENAAVDMDRIEDVLARNNDLTKLNNASVAEYRQELMNVNNTLEKRKEIAKNIVDIESDTRNMKMQNVKELYGNYKGKNFEAFARINIEFGKELNLANRYFNTMTQGGELTITQQKELLNVINDITTGLDKSFNEEQKAQFRSYFTDAIDANKEFYNSTRRTASTLAQMEHQEAINSANELKKSKLEILQEEIQLRKQQYAMLAAYERNMGEDAAKEAFGYLQAQGANYTEFLANKVNAVKSKPNKTKEDNVNLGFLFQEQEANNPKDKFNAEPFKQEIEEKKKLYGQDINAYLDYLETLRKASQSDTTTVGTQKRVIIDTANKSAKDEKQTALDNLLNKYQSHYTKLSSLQSSYNADMLLLGEALTSASTQSEKNRISETMDLRTDAHVTSLAKMEAENASFTSVLFGDLRNISKEALSAAITEAKAFIAKWKDSADLTPETEKMLTKIEKGIEGAEKKSKSNLSQDLQAAANGLKDCASAAYAFDETLGSVVESVGDVAQGAANIASGIAQMSMNPIQGAASILSGIMSIVGGIGKRIAENKKIQEEYLQSLVEAYSKELEYNGILRERLRIQQQIGESALQYFTRLQEELKAQSGSISKEYNEVWRKLMGKEYVSGTGYQHGTWFSKAKTWNEYSGLAGKSYEDIESLYTQDKLEGSAKTLFERLRTLKEEGASVVEMMDNLNEEMKTSFTGTTSNAILDSIAQGLQNGKRYAKDFADDFEGLMRNAMIQSIKMQYLEAPLQRWYEDYAKASQNGLTEDAISKLRDQYNAIINDATKHAEEMEKVTGVGIGGNTAQQVAKAGAFQSLNQDTGNELNGRFTAIQNHTFDISDKVTAIRDVLFQCAEQLIKIEINTRYCKHLERMLAIMEEQNRFGLKVK